MRPASIDFQNAERATTLTPRHTVTMRREHMRRVSDAYSTASGVNLNIPQTYLVNGATLISAWRTSDKKGYIGYGHQLNSSSATLIENGDTPGTMRYGLAIEDKMPMVYRAVSVDGRWRIQKSSFSGSGLYWKTVGTDFGSGALDTADCVRRIENIIPLSDGHIVVVEGTHQLNNSKCYLRFYVVDTWNAITLIHSVEFDAPTVYTNWIDINKSACFCTACLTPVGIHIIATADDYGYAIQWTLVNGVESDQSPILPLSVQSDSARLFPVAITPMNGTLYLTAGVVRQQMDQNGSVSQTYYEGLLLASDIAPGNWSFGELNHFLSPNYRNGTLLYVAQSGYLGQIWHVGNGSMAVFNPPSSSETNVSGRITEWKLSQNEGSADQFSAVLANGDGALNRDANVDDDAILYLKSGHESVGQIPIGAYRVQLSREITTSGHGRIAVSGQDAARSKINDTILPFYGQLLGRASFRTVLTDLNGLKLKTANRGFSQSENGLVYSGINDPFFAEINARNNGNFLIEAIVTAKCDNKHHLASVGFGIGYNDTKDGKSGDGNVFLVSKAHEWAGHIRKTSRVRKLSLSNNGWELTKRGSPLVEQVGEGQKITEDAEAGYSIETEYMIPAATKTNIAMRVFGEWASFYVKTNDMRPSVCSANAVYKCVSRARFSSTTPKIYGKEARAGLVISQDVYSSKSAFVAAAWKDVELSLTDAQIAKGVRASAYNTPISGLIYEFVDQPNVVSGTYVQGDANTRFTTELRVGQSLKMSNKVRVIASITDDHNMHMTDNGGGTTSAHQAYIRSAQCHGWASSRHIEQKVGDDMVIYHNPGADKKVFEVGGRCIFVSNDNTALSVRRVYTDGVEHWLADMGWDATNPIPVFLPGVDPSVLSPGSSSSDPNNWRAVFRSGLIAKAKAATFGLPDGTSQNEYMIVDDEVIRYVETSFPRFAEDLSATQYEQKETWLEIPVVFGVPEGQDVPSVIISPHMAGNPFGNVKPGDLLEVTSRNQGGENYFVYEPDKTMFQRYAAGVGNGNVTAGRYDKQYGKLLPEPLDVTLNIRDICIFSGRAQFGTAKVSHNPDAWVGYYPVGSDGQLPEISVHRMGFWSGEFISVEKGIQKLCALAGVNDVAFRNANEDMTVSGYSTLSLNGTSPTVITEKILADFTLMMDAPIPSGADRLSVYLRDYYKLVIFQTQAGTVSLRLQTTKTTAEGGVDEYNGERNLSGVDVVLSNYLLIGNYPILVSAIGTEIVVQIAGQPVWTFDLEAFVGDGYNYMRTDAGHIYIQMPPALGTVKARLIELGNEIGDAVISADQSIASAIGNMLQFTNVQSRSRPSGGVEFSEFWKRDRNQDVTGLICTDKFGGFIPSLAGHVIAIGDGASADWIDDQVIGRYGYRYAQVRVGGVKTIEQARRAARLALRDMKEKTFTRAFSGFGLLTAQPGDVIKIGYRMGDDPALPMLPMSDFVIADLELSADQAAVKANWRVREAYAP